MNDKVTLKEPIVSYPVMLACFFGSAFIFFGLAYTLKDYKLTSLVVSELNYKLAKIKTFQY